MSALLHERFPELRASLPRLELCRLPTPVRELPRLAERTGAPLWMKDDSRTAELWGGNKPRKLEWVLADAERRRFRTVLTFGALATNHGLATALYARERGLRCVLALTDQPVDEHVERQLERIAASGARVHRTRDAPRTVLALPWLLARYAQLRPPRPPYPLPPGGSSAVGALGFVEAALELAAQVERGELPAPRAVVIAFGTGGTAAGLAAGLRIAGLRARVLPVLVNDQIKLSEKTVLRLARRTLRLLERRGAGVGGVRVEDSDVEVVHGFLGEGYGHPTAEAREAIRLAADEEGVRLDPVYTGKTMAAILGRACGDGPLLYWHTYGAAG